jgi:hypothetical protein
MESNAGLTMILVSVAAVTVNVVVLETEPYVAPMVVVPGIRPAAIPWLPTALLIVAIVVLDELQITEFVRFRADPSL